MLYNAGKHLVPMSTTPLPFPSVEDDDFNKRADDLAEVMTQRLAYEC